MGKQKRYCRRCGHNGPWASAQAVHCVACQEVIGAERTESRQSYAAARYRAIQRLIGENQLRFAALLAQERQG